MLVFGLKTILDLGRRLHPWAHLRELFSALLMVPSVEFASKFQFRCPRFSTTNDSVQGYRGNLPIRNREFLIWAKGKGGVSPSRAAIFKKCKAV